jgi:DNA polymerase V
MPYFKAKPILEKHDVTWFSSNYALYGDLSRRVFDTISQFVPALEHYSIDEAFVHFEGGHGEEDAREFRRTVRRWTGIPVSVGIGPTKVLAKIAASVAKKRPEYGGVVDLSGAEAERHLADFDVGGCGASGRATPASSSRRAKRTPGSRTCGKLPDSNPSSASKESRRRWS